MSKEEFPLYTRDNLKDLLKVKSNATVTRMMNDLGVKAVRMGGKTLYNKKAVNEALQCAGL